jgi:hypothetical protein
VSHNRFCRAPHVLCRIRLSQLERLREAHSAGDVAVEHVVRARLVGDHIGRDSALNDLGEDIGRVAQQSDRDRFARAPRAGDELERFVEIPRLAVEVARREAPLDARLVHLDDECRGALHRRRERLRAAHSSQTGGKNEASAKSSGKMLLCD